MKDGPVETPLRPSLNRPQFIAGGDRDVAAGRRFCRLRDGGRRGGRGRGWRRVRRITRGAAAGQAQRKKKSAAQENG